MSRIGKKPITIPEGVTVQITGDTILAKGKYGENRVTLHPEVAAQLQGDLLTVSVSHPEFKAQRALWGLFRALLANLIAGVVAPFEKKLEMVGVGYRAALDGKKLVLEVGFSHPETLEIPEGLTCKVEKNIITITGADKQQVGAVAAKIRAIRKPEPYKGKGIKYVGEVVRRKAGKAAKAAGAQ